MTSRDNLSMNLKYYRKKYNLSQEEFGEYIGSNEEYISQLENMKRKPTIDMLDKIASGINNIDNNAKVKGSDLITYYEDHVTNYKRIDEKTKEKINN